MSIVRCNYCDININTDYNAEHFVAGTEHCLTQVQDAAPDLLEALKDLTVWAEYRDNGDFTLKQAEKDIKKATENKE